MKWTYKYSYDALMDAWNSGELESLKPGDAVLVYSRTNYMTGYEEYRLSKAFAETGYPGNTDPSYKTFHGWRGTTNNISVYAHGVYRIKSVEDTIRYDKDKDPYDYTGHLKIVLDKKDIKRDEE